MFEMKLSGVPIRIIKAIEQAGHRADIVGGCVRDALCGIPPHDYDITTDATPEEILLIFQGERVIETGRKHGTVTLMMEGEPYEITTYRIDGDYQDGRHPSEVTFTKELSFDLSRRDFTMNAICYSPRYGLTDLFGGRADIEEKLVRAVGDPILRFREDALRILRAIRFASVLGFSLEEQTACAVHSERHLLGLVSVERIFEEFKKLLMGKGAELVLARYADVIDVFLPELRLGTLSVPDFPADADFSERLLLLSARASVTAEAFRALSERLHTDKGLRVLGMTVLSSLDAPADTDSALCRLLYKIGKDAAIYTLRVRIALGSEDRSALSRLRSVIERGLPYQISHLQIGGGELLSLGIRGVRIGDTLEKLLLSVIDGCVENERAALLRYVSVVTELSP